VDVCGRVHRDEENAAKQAWDGKVMAFERNYHTAVLHIVLLGELDLEHLGVDKDWWGMGGYMDKSMDG
jgi:hypothetical protein